MSETTKTTGAATMYKFEGQKIAYINNTMTCVDEFHAEIIKACDNGGVFGEDLADTFELRRPAGVWILNWA